MKLNSFDRTRYRVPVPVPGKKKPGGAGTHEAPWCEYDCVNVNVCLCDF